jgi:transposase-like protein
MITQTRHASSFSETERRAIIEEYLKGGRTKVEIWRHYTGYRNEHGQILRWMRQLGYVEKTIRLRPLSLYSMPVSNKPQPSIEELQQRIKQLEQQLLDSQLKEEAYRRMIDIAEKELKVSIKKKSDTK